MFKTRLPSALHIEAVVLFKKPSVYTFFMLNAHTFTSVIRLPALRFHSVFFVRQNSSKHPAMGAAATRALGVLEKSRRGSEPTHPRRQARAAADDFRPYLGDVARRGERFARGSPGTKSPFPPEDLLESGIGIYLCGLGLNKPDD